MLDFKPVEVGDKELISAHIPEACKNMCDFTMGNLVAWGIAENTRVAQKDGFIFLRSRFNGVKSYAFPWGSGDIKNALKILEDDSCERGAVLSFYCVAEEQLSVLSGIYGGRVKVQEQRDFFDYVYLCENLATLKGRRYHSKKNHVNSFCKKNN